MQALDIHWSARRSRATPVGLLLALAAVLCSGWVALDYADADAESQALQARQARLARAQRNSQTGLAARSKPAGQSGQRNTTTVGDAGNARGSAGNNRASAAAGDSAQSAAAINAQLQRPWDALLRTLENTQVKDVALLSLDAQAANHSLHLVAESKGMEPALAYAQALSASPPLQKVVLTGQEDKPQGATPLTRFALDASWGETP